METGGIPPVTPRLGIAGIGDRGDRRGKQGAFDEALQKEQKDKKQPGENDAGAVDPAPAKKPSSPGLQRQTPPGRQDSTDGDVHVDVVV